MTSRSTVLYITFAVAFLVGCATEQAEKSLVQRFDLHLTTSDGLGYDCAGHVDVLAPSTTQEDPVALIGATCQGTDTPSFQLRLSRSDAQSMLSGGSFQGDDLPDGVFYEHDEGITVFRTVAGARISVGTDEDVFILDLGVADTTTSDGLPTTVEPTATLEAVGVWSFTCTDPQTNSPVETTVQGDCDALIASFGLDL